MPSDPDRRTVLKGVGSLGAAGLLAGCTQTGGGGGGGGTGTTTAKCVDPIDTQIGMVYALGGLGDKSFNDMANRGVKRARCRLGIEFKNLQPSNKSDFKTFQRNFATSTNPDYELVCCIGFLQNSALTANAKNYPDQKFMSVDFVPMKDTNGDGKGDTQFDNVAGYTFKEHEGSFQVGHLAGLMTGREFSAGAGSTKPDSTNVGFVGGLEVPLIKKFEAGYIAGVKHANSDVDVSSAYVGSFSDPAGGKEAALSMYNSGADIVYHAAGGTGAGVFQAAQEQGRYAIGVDADQSKSNPKFKDVILASMVKRVNNAVFTSIKNVVNGNFQGGTNVSLGLERNGVECVYGQSLGPEIPKEVKSAIDSSRKAIINGDISVPKSP